jgi:glycosyltransferase involved in cell wall biosynthesis
MNATCDAGALSSRPHVPRVSVIIIFLNAERFLAEAIESVLAQDFQDFDLILLDDGSRQECTSIARDYAQRFPARIRYMEHPDHENRGMSASRNLGLSEARGEFVAFIDADDVWQPSKLREQVAIMDAHPGLGMVCGAVRYWSSWNGGEDVIQPTGHFPNAVIQPPEAGLALYPLGDAAAPCPSDLLLRRDLVSTVGGFEPHFTGARQLYEDQAFLAKFYLVAQVYFSDQVWLNYRRHDDSCVAEVNRNGHYHEVREYFLNWFERYLSAKPETDPRVEAALGNALWRYRHPSMQAVRDSSSAMWQRFRRISHRLLRAVAGKTD